MYSKTNRKRTSFLVAAFLSSIAAPAVFADSSSEDIKLMRDQIKMLEQRLADMETKAQQDRQNQEAIKSKVDSVAAKPVVAPEPASHAPDDLVVTVSKDNTVHFGGVNVKLNGFLAAEDVYRSSSAGGDINTPFRSIPFPTNNNAINTALPNAASNANQSEFRGSARQSRISLLADGKVTDNVKVEGYYETDFLGASSTSNLNQSNSYVLRLRNLYTNIDWANEGFHLLAGQSWSLANLNSKGIIQRTEKTPTVIDAQYVPGFTWARQWQVRLVKDWGKKYWAGISFESPQTVNVQGFNPAQNTNTVTALSGGLLNGCGSAPGANACTMSANNYPDIITKFAADFDFGHFEVYNLTRNFQSTYGLNLNSPNPQSTWTTAFGGGAIIPIWQNNFELTLSALYGNGIGRYGTSQLADATFNQNGSLKPLTGSQLLAGLTWHATSAFDLYAYAGQEKVDAASGLNSNRTVYGFGNGVNAGSPLVNNISQETIGFWWNMWKGNYGTMKFGTQYSHIQLTAFSSAAQSNSNPSLLNPATTDDMVFTSLRYYPFQ